MRRRPQSGVSVVLLELVGEAHFVQLVDGPRRQAVAAGLLPREYLALDDSHLVAVPSEPVGS